MVGFLTSISAQTSIVSSSSTVFTDFTQNQIDVLGKVQAIANSQGTWSISIRPLNESLVNRNLKITIPGEDCGELIFRTKSLSYILASDYTWYGEMLLKDSLNCYDGDGMLINRNGIISGYFSVEDRFYSIKTLQDAGTAPSRLILMKNGPITNQSCGYEGEDSIPEDTTKSNDREGYCPVRVLVLVTSSAAAEDPTYVSSINLQFARIRQCFVNSGISSNDLDLILAGVVVVPPTTVVVVDNNISYTLDETGSTIPKIVNILSRSTIPFTQPNYLSSLRTTYAADILVCLPNRRIMSPDGSSARASEENAAAALHIRELNSTSYTFEHELGHVFGAEHESCEHAAFTGFDCNKDNQGGGVSPLPARAYTFYRKGWGSSDKRKRRTIVYSLLEENGRLIPQYSGIYGDQYSNNASFIKSRACSVATYNNDDILNTFYALIDPLSSVCEGGPFALTSRMFGNTGPYTYAWYASLDGGITYGSSISSMSYVNYSVPSPFNNSLGLTFKLEIINAFGVKITLFREISVLAIDFVAWLGRLGTAIAGIFKNQATLTDIGIPS